MIAKHRNRHRKAAGIANVLYYSKKPIDGQNVSYIAVESDGNGKGRQNGSCILPLRKTSSTTALSGTSARSAEPKPA